MSLEDLKRIVNPYNWSTTTIPSSSSRWRCSQQPRLLNDGWRRVREKVRVVEGFTLLTPLKYFPYEDPKRPFEAILEYDLDKSAINTGDGKVTVDRGYIRMESKDPAHPAAQGVRVATRKIVHITGIPPWVQAQLVCSCGYGTSSADFLLEARARTPREPNRSCSSPATRTPRTPRPRRPRRRPPRLHRRSTSFPQRSKCGPTPSKT